MSANNGMNNFRNTTSTDALEISAMGRFIDATLSDAYATYALALEANTFIDVFAFLSPTAKLQLALTAATISLAGEETWDAWQHRDYKHVYSGPFLGTEFDIPRKFRDGSALTFLADHDLGWRLWKHAHPDLMWFPVLCDLMDPNFVNLERKAFRKIIAKYLEGPRVDLLPAGLLDFALHTVRLFCLAILHPALYTAESRAEAFENMASALRRMWERRGR